MSAVLGATVVYDQTVADAFGSPAGNTAVAQAQAALVAAGATTTSGPVLLDSHATTSGPGDPGTTTDNVLDHAVTNVTTTDTFGPATILVGPNQSQSFFVQAGTENINQNTGTSFYINVETQETVTNFAHYQLTGQIAVPGFSLTLPTPTQTTTTLSCSPNPASVGQEVTCTATVSPTPTGGTVSFTDDGNPNLGCTSVPVNTITGQAVCDPTYPSPGTHRITATYSGALFAFDSSTSHPVTATVNSVPPTSVSLDSSANPSTTGQEVVYVAAVSPVPDGGTISFFDGRSAIAGCSSVPVSTTTGRASCDPTYPSAATHSISATYSGDQDFSPSSSPPLSQVIDVPGSTTVPPTPASPAPHLPATVPPTPASTPPHPPWTSVLGN
ncbi:MAG TPA: Ig-like domain repeat protein [Acidimicrobiales bacterium]|nr:Ig-like domain repeat protein [Acidimicrobiales bacterium]